MTRAERRRSEKKRKVRTYTLTDIQIDKIKHEAVNEATHEAFLMMLAMPVMTLLDKEGWKKKRLSRFTDQLMDLFDSHAKGLLTHSDMLEVLKSEAGMDIEMHRRDNG